MDAAISTISVPRRRPKNRSTRWLLWALLGFVLGLLVLYPMMWLLLGAFQTSTGEFTFAHLERVFTVRYFKVLWTTVQYVGWSTLLAATIGIPLAWLAARTDLPGKELLRSCIALTYVNPPFLQTMAYVFALSPNAGFINILLDKLLGVKPFNIYSMEGLIFVTALWVYPQVFMIVDSALRSMDPSLEEAAATAGARPWSIATHVTLPLVAPALLSSTILTAVMVLALFAPPAMLGTPARVQVLTTQIYQLLSSLPIQLEFASALSLIFLTITGILLYAQSRVLRQRSFTTIMGKAVYPKLVPLGLARPWATVLAFSVPFLSLILPLGVLLVVSLLKAWGNWFAPGNVTLDNYVQAILFQSRTRAGFLNTLILGAVTVLGTVLISLLMSFLVGRKPTRGSAVLQFITFLPFSVPGVVFTVGVILAFIRPPFNLYGTLAIIAVCYLARFLPMAVQPIENGLKQIDWSLVEAAHTTGARWATVTRTVVLPLIKFTLLSTGLLVFMSTTHELVSAVFLYSSGTQTVMVSAWQFWEEGKTEMTAAIVVVMFLVVLLLQATARRLVGRQLF